MGFPGSRMPISPARAGGFYGISVIREGLAGPREPALLTSAGRMPERSQHRVSEGQRAPIRLGGLVDVANVRRWGPVSPELLRAICSCN